MKNTRTLARNLLYFVVLLVPVVIWGGTHHYVAIKTPLVFMAIFVFACLSTVRVIQKKEMVLPWTLACLPPLLFLVIATLSLIFSPFPKIGVWQFSDLLLSLAVFFWAVMVIKDKGSLKMLYSYWLIAVIIVCLYSIAHWILPEIFTRRSLMGNPNFEAGWLVLALPLIISMLLFKYQEWRQNNSLYLQVILLSLMAMIVGFVLVLKGARGAALGIMGGMFVLLFCWGVVEKDSFARRRFKLICLGLVLAIAVAFWIGHPILFQDVRFHIWGGVIRMVGERPLLGWGWGNFMTAYDLHAAPGPWQDIVRHAHSEPLEILAETGIPGLSAFILILVLFFQRGLRLLKSNSDPKLKMFVAGLMAGVAGIMSHNLVSVNLRFTSSFIPMWIALGAVIGIEAKEKRIALRKVSRLSLAILSMLIIISVAHYGKHFIVNPFLAEYHLRQGTRYIHSTELGEERLDKAMRRFVRASSLDPTFLRAYWYIAVLHEKRGRYRQALTAHQSMGKFIPKWAGRHSNMAHLYLKLGENTSAIKKFRQALNLNPYVLSDYLALGNLYLSRMMYEEALTLHRQALAKVGKHFTIYNNIGNIYREIGNIKAALRAYRKAHKLKPQSLKVLGNLLLIYQLEGKEKEAEEIIRKLKTVR
ncbi:tetratricopeptide repeat protein [candidate division NPL-UPA2 bacterium]|nr:tetratricopeptide repeat protein [candidate division NPL-UPA2 bacterium]